MAQRLSSSRGFVFQALNPEHLIGVAAASEGRYGSFRSLAHAILDRKSSYSFSSFQGTDFSTKEKMGYSSNLIRPLITFVLGGPGSGKGTQCEKIAETFGFVHLSAGDLLRKEILSSRENGSMILDIIKEGKIVPSEITVNLIRREIELSENRRILIDGFPRTDENRISFERILGVEPNLVIFFDCPEEVMVKRLLSRNQGRIDDNIKTIKKRLDVFDKLNRPVINYYSSKGKVHKINSVGTTEEIFEKVKAIFASLSLT